MEYLFYIVLGAIIVLLISINGHLKYASQRLYQLIDLLLEIYKMDRDKNKDYT